MSINECTYIERRHNKNKSNSKQQFLSILRLWGGGGGEQERYCNASCGVAAVRSQLREMGRLLAEAEHSFQSVASGFGDAGGTIATLSTRLDQTQKELLKAERELVASRAQVVRLQKVGVCFGRVVIFYVPDVFYASYPGNIGVR